MKTAKDILEYNQKHAFYNQNSDYRLKSMQDFSEMRLSEFKGRMSQKIKEAQDKIDFINKSDFKTTMSGSKELHRLRGIKKVLKELIQ